MKTSSANLTAHLSEELTTLATLWRVTRKDGQQFFFTDHDADVTVGSETYLAATSYRRSAVRASDDMSSDRFELAGIIDSVLVTESDLRAGAYDGAVLEVFVVNWASPADGTVQLKRGRLGKVTLEEGGYRVEFRDLMDALESTVGDVYTAGCIVDLGSVKCGVRLDPPAWAATTAYIVRPPRDAALGSIVKPSVESGLWFICTVAGTSDATEPTWPGAIGGTVVDGTVTWKAIQALRLTGTVTSVTDRRTFADTDRSEANGWWDFGVLTWTNNDNIGLSMEVEVYLNAGGDFTLKLEMPYDIQIGDTYEITVGCDKSLAACRDKFDNVLNFRGYGAHLPGNEEILRYPDAK